MRKREFYPLQKRRTTCVVVAQYPFWPKRLSVENNMAGLALRASEVNNDEQACISGGEFVKLYYETLDSRRHMLSKLYMEDATMSWNGNGVQGNQQIKKFYEELPNCETTVNCVDAQALIEEIALKQTTIVVLVLGAIRFDNKPMRTFQQNFMLTVQNGNWNVVTDCFRFQETV